MGKAPRLLCRFLLHSARGVLLASSFWLSAQGAVAQAVPEARLGDFTAWFDAPTDRYGHAIMGNLPEWGQLCIASAAARVCITLPETSVFEDIAPRLFDLDHDGTPEAIVVESSVMQGAALVVYRLAGQRLERIATPPIGTRNRWLAPAAIADLDGDGHIELAYVDRPHLAKRLRVWRYKDGVLSHIADRDGLTNHRIGEPFISGGLRICGQGAEIITADANWSRIMSSMLVDGDVITTDLGPYSKAALARVMGCGT